MITATLVGPANPQGSGEVSHALIGEISGGTTERANPTWGLSWRVRVGQWAGVLQARTGRPDYVQIHALLVGTSYSLFSTPPLMGMYHLPVYGSDIVAVATPLEGGDVLLPLSPALAGLRIYTCALTSPTPTHGGTDIGFTNLQSYTITYSRRPSFPNAQSAPCFRGGASVTIDPNRPLLSLSDRDTWIADGRLVNLQNERMLGRLHPRISIKAGIAPFVVPAYVAILNRIGLRFEENFPRGSVFGDAVVEVTDAWRPASTVRSFHNFGQAVDLVPKRPVNGAMMREDALLGVVGPIATSASPWLEVIRENTLCNPSANGPHTHLELADHGY